MTADELDGGEWESDWEWLPLYLMWAGIPMDFEPYWESQRDAAELPEVWE